LAVIMAAMSVVSSAYAGLYVARFLQCINSICRPANGGACTSIAPTNSCAKRDPDELRSYLETCDIKVLESNPDTRRLSFPFNKQISYTRPTTMHLFGLHLDISPFFCGLVAHETKKDPAHTKDPSCNPPTEVGKPHRPSFGDTGTDTSKTSSPPSSRFSADSEDPRDCGLKVRVVKPKLWA
jgi:hypothetical protein